MRYHHGAVGADAVHAVNHPEGKLERDESLLVLHAMAGLVQHLLSIRIAVDRAVRETAYLANGVLGGNVLHQKVRP